MQQCRIEGKEVKNIGLRRREISRERERARDRVVG